ncbi:helix-turn-helix transcriptional regulator [Citricoccus parietis]
MTTESTAMPEQRTVSLPYAGRVLGIGKSTAYELAARGEFPVRVLQLGRKKLVSRAELDSYLDGEPKNA